MGDAACMLRSAEVSVQKNSFLVCVSATSGTTNLLIELGQKAKSSTWDNCQSILNKIYDRHKQIAKELSFADRENQLQTLFAETESIAKGIFLLRDCSERALDALVSLGERMSSVLFAEAFQQKLKSSGQSRKVVWLDARDIICTDDQFGKARPQIEKISERAQQKILSALDPQNHAIVTQGFIGRSEEGQTTTLGRGGSDYSAALFAEALNADVLEIWTDVAGIATTDPRLCSDAKMLEEISFKEASELATFGAKVLHPATLAPAMRKNIPVFVGSSFDPQSRGTWIRKEVASAPLVRAMALRKKQVLVTLSTPDMLHNHGFLFKIFKVFNDNKVSVDAITTSEISVSLTLDDATLLNKKLIQELSQFAEVHIEENLSLISLIGNNINHTPGLSKKIFESIPDVNVRMICLGASKHNFCFLVADENGPKVVQKLHQSFALQN